VATSRRTGVPKIFNVIDLGPSWTSFYDTSPLRVTLLEFIDIEKIQRISVKLFVTATNVATGRIERVEL
jgi:hypothetical protein